MDISHTQSFVPRPRVTPQKRRTFCDPLGRVQPRRSFRRYQDVVKKRRHMTSVLSHAGRRTSLFYTEDSHRYISPTQSFHMTRGRTYHDRRRYFDSVQVRYNDHMSAQMILQQHIDAQFESVRSRMFGFREMMRWGLSPVRMWQFSMTGAMLFGMITMSMIYKNLGQTAYASDGGRTHAMDPVAAMIIEGGTEAITTETSLVTTADMDIVPGKLPLEDDIVAEKSPEQKIFEENATRLLAGHPMEKMLPYLFDIDREVAIYMIAMAKMESNWGKRSPVLNGKDCYNYWGYRAQRERMGSGGHTCFDDRLDAVQTVAKRVHALYYEYERTTPRQMLVWKCGSSCAGHSPEGVERWVNVITQYRNALKGD